MNNQYLHVGRGQKLDGDHNGTTRVAIAFRRLRYWITRATRETGGTTKRFSELNSWAKKSIPDAPVFQKREKDIGNFAV